MRRLEDELIRYSQTDAYPFHMPGHKRQAGWLPDAPSAAIDITEIDGFDNLHDPQGLILEEMKNAARFYGVRQTFFSVNGATCALLAAISAAAPRGSRLLIERTCHMAVYHAAYLRGMTLAYITEALAREVTAGTGGREAGSKLFEGGSIREDLHESAGIEYPGSSLAEAAPEECQGSGEVSAGFSAIVITSPTYEGCVKDVAAWAAYAHARGAVLIVDEAHGAHFSMHPAFPVSATGLGADLVVQSTHKTLPAMTQTALLHQVSDRVEGSRIQYFFDIYETSSPSYLLLASITSAIHLCMDRGDALFEAYWQRLRRLRLRLSALRCCHLAGGAEGVLAFDDELPGFAAGTVMDPGKLVLVGDGPALYAALRDRFHLQPEMKTAGYVLCMTSLADTDEGFDRLAGALETLDAEAQENGLLKVLSDGNGASGSRKEGFERPAGSAVRGRAPGSRRLPADHPLAPQPLAMTLAEAVDAPRERVPLGEAAGRIAGDFLILYPPDVPVIVPGEVFTQELIDSIRAWRRAGLAVLGADDEKADLVRR